MHCSGTAERSGNSSSCAITGKDKVKIDYRQWKYDSDGIASSHSWSCTPSPLGDYVKLGICGHSDRKWPYNWNARYSLLWRWMHLKFDFILHSNVSDIEAKHNLCAQNSLLAFMCLWTKISFKDFLPWIQRLALPRVVKSSMTWFSSGLIITSAFWLQEIALISKSDWEISVSMAT